MLVCGAIGSAGVCVDVPTGCPDVWDPVCGCDGKTYGNDCTRKGARAQKDHDGECGPPEGRGGGRQR